MKYILIKPNLPINYELWMSKYFYNKRIFRVKISEIKYLKNTFVSNQGLVLKNNFLVKRSAFNLIGFEDNTFYFKFWKHTLHQKFVCKYGKSLKSLKLDFKKQYFIIHSKWFNYSFWINSYLIRLLTVEKEIGLDNVVLIYPSEWDNISYVIDSLKCFDVQIERIPIDNHLFIPNLILPETRQWTSSFNPNELKLIKEKIVPFSIKFKRIVNFFENIYLTRKKRETRTVQNEAELLPILSKYNFKVLDFEDYSFWDQVYLMNNVKNFISIHGAGFSNVIFMNEGSSVLELVNEEYANLEYKFPFWRMSDASNLKYYIQFGKVRLDASSKLIKSISHNDNTNYLVNENICIDPILFEKNIQLMINNI